MIGVAIAFIVVGVIFLFLIPWVGIAAGIVGLVLAILWVAGFGRRAAERDAYRRPGPRLRAFRLLRRQRIRRLCDSTGYHVGSSPGQQGSPAGIGFR